LSSGQCGLPNAFPVDKGSIGGFAIAHHQLLPIQNDFAMACRNGDVLDLKMILRMPPDGINAEVEDENAPLKSFTYQLQPSHFVCGCYLTNTTLPPFPG
jgi:hypothetical protein